MCARSVKRPVKAWAKGGYGNQPPPSIPPEPAFHPAICAWGLVCVFHLFIKNIQESTLKYKPCVDDWCCVSGAVCSTFKPLQTFTPGNYHCNPWFFFLTEEIHWSYWRWRWQWEISKVFKLENIWNGPRWFHPHENTTILHFSRDWRNLTISSL